MDNKDIVKSWRFASNSNPNKTYETVQYADGSTSCQCMGWCVLRRGATRRECTHTRMVEAGIADQHAVPGSIIDRTQNSNVRAPNVRDQARTSPKAAKATVTKVQKRKILW